MPAPRLRSALTLAAAATGIGVDAPVGSSTAARTVRESSEELYAVNADGSPARRLAGSQAVDDKFAWSPDGTKRRVSTLGHSSSPARRR